MTQAKISTAFATAMRNINSSFATTGTIDGKTAYSLTYSSYVDQQLSPFGHVQNQFSTWTSLTDNTSYNNNIFRQCVGFVRASNSSIPGTSSWQGNVLAVNSLVNEGDIIATFTSGVYDGHAAIVVQVTSTGFWVMDQNWTNGGVNGGYIMIHFIDKNGSGVGNINNYYMVEY